MQLLFYVIRGIFAFIALCVKAFGCWPFPDTAGRHPSPVRSGSSLHSWSTEQPWCPYLGVPCDSSHTTFYGCSCWQALCPVPSRELITQSKRFWTIHFHGKDGQTFPELGGWKPKGAQDSTLPFWVCPLQPCSILDFTNPVPHIMRK